MQSRAADESGDFDASNADAPVTVPIPGPDPGVFQQNHHVHSTSPTSPELDESVPPQSESPTENEFSPQTFLRVFAYFLIMMSGVGVQYTFGIFLVEFLKEFEDAEVAEVASVGALSTGTMEFVAIFSGMCVTKYGERVTSVMGSFIAGCGMLLASQSKAVWHLMLSYGVMMGFGHSLCLFSGVVLMNKIFKKRRGIASGVATTGSGVGTSIFSSVIPGIVDRVGVWSAMQMLAGFCFCISIAGSLLFTIPGSQKAGPPPPPAGWRDSLTQQHVKRALIGTTLASFGLWMPTVYLARYGADLGFTEEEARRVVTMFGVGSMVVRLPVTYMGDVAGQRRVTSLVMVVFGVTTLLLPLYGEVYALFLAYGVLVGGMVGSFMALLGPLMAELVELTYMPKVTTTSFTLLGLGFAGGPAIGGAIYDTTGSFAGSFVFAGVMGVLGGVTILASNRRFTLPRCLKGGMLAAASPSSRSGSLTHAAPPRESREMARAASMSRGEQQLLASPGQSDST